MKKKQIVLIILAIIVLLYIISVVYKLNILNKIIQTNANTLTKEDNIYYFLQGNNHNEEYWRKGNIVKSEIKRPENTSPDIIFWRDYSSKKQYTFIPSTKIYSVGTVGLSLPNSQLASYSSKLTMAILPLYFINTIEYNTEKCYCIKILGLGVTEYITKDTGLLVYSKSGNDEFDINYSFGAVTDKDVLSPNIEEYTFQ